MGARTRIASVTRWARGLFPVRVWLHFLDRNGFLLAAGMSYQALFAVFAAAYNEPRFEQVLAAWPQESPSNLALLLYPLQN